METLKVLVIFYCVGIFFTWLNWCVRSMFITARSNVDSQLYAAVGIFCSIFWLPVTWYLITEWCMSYRKGK